MKTTVEIVKTTVEIAKPLLDEARGVAAKEKTTLRALIEEGLRLSLDRRSKRAHFRLRDVSFGGRGLRPELKGASWKQLRNAIYESRSA